MFQRAFTLFMAPVLMLSLNAVQAEARTGPQSIVIGRLTGTLLTPPRTLLGNSPNIGGSRGSVEFKGFRLVGEDTGTFAIRPLGDGYFQRALPPGKYSLVRFRRDRPSYKEEKTVTIMTFSVPQDALVNLGTLDVVLQGDPGEVRYRISGRQGHGTYTYRYRYERVPGEEALMAPLRWFREKEAVDAARYEDRVETIRTQPADITDSSRLTLRKTVFRHPLMDWPR